MVVASLVVGTWFIYPVLKLQYQHEREVQTLEAQLGTLKQSNSALRAKLNDLSTPSGIEQAARESLGYVKPGEEAYVVTGGDTTQTADTDTSGSHEPIAQRLLDLVFGFN